MNPHAEDENHNAAQDRLPVVAAAAKAPEPVDDDPLGMQPAAADSSATNATPPSNRPRLLLILGWSLAGIALLLAAWLRYSQHQLQQQLTDQIAQLTTQSRDNTQQLQAMQDKAEQARIKMALMEERLAETDAQRARTDAALQNLASSRESALVAELRARIHGAYQQAQLSGQAQPLLDAMTDAQQRLTAAPQPALLPLQRAITQDLASMKAATLLDLPQLANSVDGVLQRAGTLPLISSKAPDLQSGTGTAPAPVPGQSRWLRLWDQLKSGALQLIRVRTIGDADSALINPEQGFFVREQLRLRLLNGRAALLAGQTSMATHDLQASRQMLDKYFDDQAPLVQSTRGVMVQLEQQLQQGKLPAIDSTLKALTQASANAPVPAPVSAPASSAASAKGG